MMQEIINYFEGIPSLHRSFILVGGITLFWLLEGIFPLFKFDYKKWRHAIPNIFFTLTTVLINFFLAFILLKTSDWTIDYGFGVLHWIPEIPLWTEVLLGVIFLDFIGAYLPHYVEHQIKPLWMIHLVHHSDHKVDTTTANRHHPLESIVRFSFTLLGVFLLGTSIGIIMLYQALSVISSQFNHANIKLPKKNTHHTTPLVFRNGTVDIRVVVRISSRLNESISPVSGLSRGRRSDGQSAPSATLSYVYVEEKSFSLSTSNSRRT